MFATFIVQFTKQSRRLRQDGWRADLIAAPKIDSTWSPSDVITYIAKDGWEFKGTVPWEAPHIVDDSFALVFQKKLA